MKPDPIDSVQILSTRERLMQALCAPGGTKYALPVGPFRKAEGYVVGYVLGVQREDGSGQKFIVSMSCAHTKKTIQVFIRYQ